MNKPPLNEILQNAYIYTAPLAIVNATMEKATNTIEPNERNAPINQLFHLRTLADSNSTLVVTPNVDTLYSQAFLDLSKQEAIILEKPESNRYYMIQVMNAYSDTLAILGTGTDGQEQNTYLFTRENYAGEIPEGVQHIKSGTDLVWIVIRIIINNEADSLNVHDLQNATHLLPLSNYLSNTDYVPEQGTYDKNKNFVPVDHVLGMSAKEYFDNVNALMVNNPPNKQDSEIMASLKTINVGPGMDFDESIFDSDVGSWETLKTLATNKASKTLKNFNTHNRIWSYFNSPIGNFGTEYEYRYMVALNGLGANPVEAAIYAKTDKYIHKNTNGLFHPLTGNKVYKIHFKSSSLSDEKICGLPPVKKYGFWSITAYGENNLLIDNTDNIYVINDRTQLKENTDGSFDIYLSTTLPEGVEKANWLPVSDGEFHLFMRIYLPSEDVQNRKWVAPTIKVLNLQKDN